MDVDCCGCPFLLMTLFDADTDTLGKTAGTTEDVAGNNGLLPPIIFLIGTEMAAIGGAERIDVSDGDERDADEEGRGGGSDFMAVI